LLWLCYCPDKSTALVNDLAVKRILSWTYRNRYDGFLLASLYPVTVDTRAQARAWRDTVPGALELVDEGAAFAAQQARRNQCADVVVATGPLDATERADLTEWLTTFRTLRGTRKVRWLCIGTTETGWPIPPVAHGRSTPPQDVHLVPWREPAETVRKRRPPVVASA
jgi:hypothetical protein